MITYDELEAVTVEIYESRKLLRKEVRSQQAERTRQVPDKIYRQMEALLAQYGCLIETMEDELDEMEAELKARAEVLNVAKIDPNYKMHMQGIS